MTPWTLCTDSLPPLEQPVWCQLKSGQVMIGGRTDIGYIDRDDGEPCDGPCWGWCQCYHVPPFDSDRKSWDSGDMEYDDDYEVIAWQTLPVPMAVK